MCYRVADDTTELVMEIRGWVIEEAPPIYVTMRDLFSISYDHGGLLKTPPYGSEDRWGQQAQVPTESEANAIVDRSQKDRCRQ